MTIARAKLVDLEVTRWYHVISRCVRRAFLLGEGDGASDRKQWIEDRLRQLDAIFAVSVGGFSVMDNHLHVLLRVDPMVADGWSAEEIVRRWFQLFPPRGSDRKPLKAPLLRKLKEDRLGDTAWLEKTRKRLMSLSWFMKCLKEPLSRMVNKQEKCRGTFFEGRFKSIAILDEESLLSVCAYIDLNPVAAGIASIPEQSEHTSVKARVDHVEKQGRTKDLMAARQGSVLASQAAKKLEEDLWLIPLEDRRRLDSKREGMVESFTLGNYLMLVEHTGRLLRRGKASISSQVAEVFDRLGMKAADWEACIKRLVGGRLYGNFIAANRDRLREVASRIGVQRLANLTASSTA